MSLVKFRQRQCCWNMHDRKSVQFNFGYLQIQSNTKGLMVRALSWRLLWLFSSIIRTILCCIQQENSKNRNQNLIYARVHLRTKAKWNWFVPVVQGNYFVFAITQLVIWSKDIVFCKIVRTHASIMQMGAVTPVTGKTNWRRCHCRCKICCLTARNSVVP